MTQHHQDTNLHVTADEGQVKKFYGKYRGKVINNVDPLLLGKYFLGQLFAEIVKTFVTSWRGIE